METKKPSVFEYTDYRGYLKDLYNHLKETTEFFSYRYFSKKAGFKSPNYLKLVIEGERNISADSISRFAAALKLTKGEADFFANLVEFTQAKTRSEKTEWALKILKSKIYQKMNPLRKEELNFCDRWYQVGIRELALCKGFKRDPEWVAQQFHPPLTKKEADDAIKSLVALGMLKEDEHGNLIPTSQNIKSENEAISSVLGIYHKNMMDKAKESIDIIQPLEREVSAICVPVSDETFQKMKNRIQDFRKALITIASEDKEPNRVYQLNLQLFPLTQKVNPS